MKLDFLKVFLIKNLCGVLYACWTFKKRSSELWFQVARPLSFLHFCKNTYFLRLKILNDITVVDWLRRDYRFQINYNLFSLLYSLRVFFFINVAEIDYLVSYYNIFKSACWLEREAWDMFGVFFLQSPDLRRILTDYGFEGYPLRKDFPLTGYLEVRYDDEKGTLVYEPVELAQEYRVFTFESPWEDLI